MAARLGFRDGMLSALVFGGVLFALVSVDPRVKLQVSDLMRTGSNMASLTHHASDLGDALWQAARDHSIDNAPLLVFATVGTVLTLFMIKS
jgi:hypothetical protein